MAQTGFHWFDYVVFCAVLVASCAIGLFYAFTGGKQKTQQEFLMANRQMKTLPVAISILVSFNSAIVILGAPAEVYLYGTQYWMYSFGIALACVLASVLFVPLLYPLKLTSSYEVSLGTVFLMCAKLTYWLFCIQYNPHVSLYTAIVTLDLIETTSNDTFTVFCLYAII